MEDAEGSHLTRAELAELLAGRLEQGAHPRRWWPTCSPAAGPAGRSSADSSPSSPPRPAAGEAEVDLYELPMARALARVRKEARRLVLRPSRGEPPARGGPRMRAPAGGRRAR